MQPILTGPEKATVHTSMRRIVGMERGLCRLVGAGRRSGRPGRRDPPRLQGPHHGELHPTDLEWAVIERQLAFGAQPVGSGGLFSDFGALEGEVVSYRLVVTNADEETTVDFGEAGKKGLYC